MPILELIAHAGREGTEREVERERLRNRERGRGGERDGEKEIWGREREGETEEERVVLSTRT